MLIRTKGWQAKSKPRIPCGHMDPKTDADLVVWRKISTEAQQQAYKGLIGWVQDWGHRAIENLSQIENGVTVEIGCGIGHHLNFLTNVQRRSYLGLDVSLEHLKASRARYANLNVVQGDAYALPFRDESIDRVYSIYLFEHLRQLQNCMKEISRVLKRDGELVGAIPTEGGIAWHIGRYFTTKRMFEKKYGIDYDKVVGYEHCNTCWDVLAEAASWFYMGKVVYLPFRVPTIHLNALVVFRATKRQ